MVNKINWECKYIGVEKDPYYTRVYCSKQKKDIETCRDCEFYQYLDYGLYQEDMIKYLEGEGF